jgi:putative addiction module component (TIGR02574 family)
MSKSGKTSLESVLALPEAERAEIAEAILSSLPEEDAREADDEAFAEELRRRGDEWKGDPGTGIAWSELKKQR